MDKPRNIFESILFGLETTNTNVVDISKEIIALREDLATIKAMLTIPPETASRDGDENAVKPKKK